MNKVGKINFDNELKNLITLEKFKCIGCKKCMAGCPMLKDFCSNPKELLEDLSNKNFFVGTLPYSCMLCGYCEKVCPKDVSFKNIFFSMRKLFIKKYTNNASKLLNSTGVDFHQGLAFSKIFSSQISNLASEICFFPGCSLLAESTELATKIYKYLQGLYPGIGLWTACCGNPTGFLGKEEVFNKRLNGLKKEYRQKGIKKIITACQNCTLLLDSYCNDVEIVPVYNILAENFPEEAINKFKKKKLKVHIQDPCPSRNYPILQKDVRLLVEKLGFEIEELFFSKEKTVCCSSGGLVPQTTPHIAKKHLDRRNREITLPTICYCKECESVLSREKEADHILDLIFLDKNNLMKKHQGSNLKVFINKVKLKL